MVICDTNIFISAFNGSESAISNLNFIGDINVLVSSITIMELYRGMPNKEQMSKMLKRVTDYNVIHFNETISKKAIDLVFQYKLSHNLDIPDAIIAATAIIYNYPLFTYNVKDFKFIPELKLYQQTV